MAKNSRVATANEPTEDEAMTMIETGQTLAEVRCRHVWVYRDDNLEISYCELCGADGNA